MKWIERVVNLAFFLAVCWACVSFGIFAERYGLVSGSREYAHPETTYMELPTLSIREGDTLK